MSKYGLCPVCKKDFDVCKHSRVEAEQYIEDQRIRMIVKQELKKHKCRCETPLAGM